MRSINPTHSQDNEMVSSFLRQEFFELVWNKVILARKKRIEAFCKSVLSKLVEDTLYELDKAYTLPARIAALSKKNRNRFYELLHSKSVDSHSHSEPFIPGIFFPISN